MLFNRSVRPSVCLTQSAFEPIRLKTCFSVFIFIFYPCDKNTFLLQSSKIFITKTAFIAVFQFQGLHRIKVILLNCDLQAFLPNNVKFVSEWKLRNLFLQHLPLLVLHFRPAFQRLPSTAVITQLLSCIISRNPVRHIWWWLMQKKKKFPWRYNSTLMQLNPPHPVRASEPFSQIWGFSKSVLPSPGFVSQYI